MLVLYADGDDEWRRQQNVEMAQVLKATGAAHVDVAQIAGRTHNTIWSKVAEPNDEAADRIIQFVRATPRPADRVSCWVHGYTRVHALPFQR